MSPMLPANPETDPVGLPPAHDGFPLPGRVNPIDSSEVLQIARMTERLFSAPVQLMAVSDPEVPSESWVEFGCTVPGTYAAYRQLKSQWYDEVARIVPGATTEFRLCLTSSHDG